ncbi:hypothetical protein MHYP_G00125900 [Metynnis hypsauchen]
MVDYATRYLEAVPLRKATSKAISQELFLLCSRVRIPKDIITNQGTPSISRLVANLCKLLRIKHLPTSIYHPQTDGLVERFNQTLKCMLGKVVAQDGRCSSRLTQWSPSSTNIWRRLSGPNSEPTTALLNPENSNRETVFWSTTTCKLLATWQGLYTVRAKVGPVNYHLDQPGSQRRKSRQVYHINLLKRWVEPPGSLASPPAKPRPEQRFNGAKSSFPPNTRNLQSWWNSSGMCSLPPPAGPRSSSTTYGLPWE